MTVFLCFEPEKVVGKDHGCLGVTRSGLESADTVRRIQRSTEWVFFSSASSPTSIGLEMDLAHRAASYMSDDEFHLSRFYSRCALFFLVCNRWDNGRKRWRHSSHMKLRNPQRLTLPRSDALRSAGNGMLRGRLLRQKKTEITSCHVGHPSRTGEQKLVEGFWMVEMPRNENDDCDGRKCPGSRAQRYDEALDIMYLPRARRKKNAHRSK